MIKKSKLRDAIAPFVGIFEFLGFADYQPGRWRILVKFLIMNAVLLVVAVDTLIVRVFRLREKNGVIHYFMYVVVAMQAFICLNLAIFNSSISLKFIKRMTEVDELLINALSINTDYDDLRWTLSTRMGASLLFHFGCAGLAIYSVIQLEPHFTVLSIAYFISILLGQIYAQRFVFMVQLLTFYLNLVGAVLEKSINNQPLLVRNDERKAWKRSMENNHNKVRVLRQAYRRLWEASCLINEWSGAGLAYNFFVQTMFIIYQGYRMCIEILSGLVNFRHYILIFEIVVSMVTTHYYSQMSLNDMSLTNFRCFWLILLSLRRRR